MNNATELAIADNVANIEDSSDSNHKMGASVNNLDKVSPMDIVVIKFGKFLNRMARVSSIGASNRYNLQIMYDNGELGRRSDGAIENTALLRSKFVFLSSDLEEAIKLLPGKRKELDLFPYVPHPPPTRRVQIGSPMNKTKTKPRTSVDASGGTDEDDDGESRNNLYWAEVSDAGAKESMSMVTASSRGYFCLWYGGSQASAEDPVAVLPITPLVVHEREAPLLLSAGNLGPEFGGSLGQSQGQEQTSQPSLMESDLYFGPTADPPVSSPLPSLPSLLAASPGASQPASINTAVDAAGAEELAELLGVSATRMVHVRRSALQPLDDDLVRTKYSTRHESDVVRHYMIALVQFAEWDYPQRESYVWPEFALRLMTDPNARDEFLDTAVRHPLNTGARPLSEVILFLLCAEHIGVLEEWDDAAFLQRGQAADSVVYLLESLNEFRTTEEAMYRPFCRVADCFQVDPSHYAVATPAPTATAAAAAPLPSSSIVIDLCSDSGSTTAEELERSAPDLGAKPAFVPSSEGRINAYLGEVELLRQQYVRPHQVVEAPLDVDVFVRNLEGFLRDRGQAVVYGESPKEQYRRIWQLGHFIAHSRRLNRRYTSLCTVKYVVTPSTGSPGVDAARPVAFSSNTGTPPASAATTLVPSPTKVAGTSPADVEAAVLDKAAMLLASSAEALGISAPSPAPRERSLIVHYGQQEVKVPIKYCRLLCVPEDLALEILHECGGDTVIALQRVAELLSSEPDGPTVEGAGNTAVTAPQPATTTTTAAGVGGKLDVAQRAAVNRIVTPPRELDCFHSLVTRLMNDLEQIHREFVRRLTRQRLRASEGTTGTSSSGNGGSGTAAGQPPAAATGPYFTAPSLESPVAPKSAETTAVHLSFTGAPGSELKSLPALKDTMRMFLIFYPHWDEDDTFPNMTSFNSSLFTQCCGNNGIASAAAARTLERAALKAANGGGETGAANRGRGRPPKGPSGSGGASGTASKGSRSAATSASATPRQTPGRPNRWPANLPTIQHNLFWITHNAQPCLCTGLHFKGKNNSGEAQLAVINIHPEARRMLVSPNQVEPFHDDLLRHAVDDKTATFASAMADFCEWELEHHVPMTSLLRRWYVYPEFITKLLVNNSRWTGWRKSVERLPRAGSGISRRENYFQALVEEYGRLSEQERSDRYNSGSFPWEDTPLSEESSDEDGDDEERSQHSDTLSGIESYGDRGECSEEEGGKVNPVRKHPARVVPSNGASVGAAGAEGTSRDNELQTALFSDEAFADNVGTLSGKKRGRPPLAPTDGAGSSQSLSKVAKAAKALSASSDDGASSSSNKATHLRSLYNLFWIPRSQLPCLYYDRKENRFGDKFLVIPICCVTYHYPFVVINGVRGPGGIEPLKMQHLKLITDERTSEFTHALLEFAQQETRRQHKARLQAELLGSQQDGSLPGVLYDGAGIEDDGDDNSLLDAAIVQPNEVFDWPDFIMDLVNKPAMWHSWRKKAERAGPGPKRQQYLRALQSDWKEKQAEQAAALHEQNILAQQSPTRTLQIHSYYNLFWLLRSNLPAIYYDREECRYQDKFTVLPINCFQYQYPTKITNSSVVIEPLSMINLAKCTDERTHDFTLALIDFAKWETDNRRALASQTNDSYFSEPKDRSTGADHGRNGGGSGAGAGVETALSTDVSAATSIDDSTELYDWPDFILHLINSPEEWSTWRKRAERSSGRESRRTVYLRALMEDYRVHQSNPTQQASTDLT